MSQIKIINSQQNAVFILLLTSKTSSKQKKEALENLKSLYPYEVNVENLIIRKNKEKNSFICIVLNSPIEEYNVIPTVLYAKNHFNYFTGNICFCSEDFSELIELDNGNVVKVISGFVENFKDVKKIEKVTEEEIYSNFRLVDIIRKDEKKRQKRNIFFVIASFIVILATIFICFHKHFAGLQADAENKKRLQEIELQKDVARIKNEKKFLEQEKEYIELRKKEFENIYVYISILYDCIKKGSVIENLSIEKNKFSVDVTTSDAVKILKNFEEKNFIIAEIKMNRSVIQNNKEYVSYTGTFLKKFEKPEDSLSLENKIAYYNDKIIQIKEKFSTMEKISVSEYTKNIREKLRQFLCSEQYIQYKTESDIAVLECLFNSTSANLLKFLDNIQNENNKFSSDFVVSISGIRIRNSDNPNNIQTTIKFWTGIKHNDDSGEALVSDNFIIDPLELSSVFFKRSSVKNPFNSKMKTINKKVEKNTEIKIATVKSKNLKYVGTTTMNGVTIVIIKDIEMNILYKLPLVSELKSSDGCVLGNNGKFSAFIRGVIYEGEK